MKAQLTKAQAHAAAHGGGEAVLLDAQLAAEGSMSGVAAAAPQDLHAFTLAAQVHWAAEGAKLAIARLLDAPAVPPAANDAKSFADLHERLDATIAYLRAVAPDDLEVGLDRAITIERPRGSLHFRGDQFLRELALPHFFYHVTTAYGILRNQGVRLTMADFLGNWETS